MSTTDIRDAAAKYLAHRSHTCKEMEQRLLEKGFHREDVDSVIADYLAYGYLDDNRYCQAYFDYAFGKGKGKHLVFAELQRKGVDRDTIQFAFENWEGEYDEKDRALQEAKKVLQLHKSEECGEPIEEKLLAKVARRLQAKGYASDTIYTVIGELRR